MTATATSPTASPGLGRRLAVALHRRPRLRLGLLLAPPLGWLVIAYLGSLAVMLASSFFSVDAFTGQIVTEPTLDNYRTILTSEVYRTVTLRTVGIAAAVTVTALTARRHARGTREEGARAPSRARPPRSSCPRRRSRTRSRP